MRERRLNVTPAEGLELQEQLNRCFTRPWIDSLVAEGEGTAQPVAQPVDAQEVWAFMRDRFGADPGPYRVCIRFDLDAIPAEGVARIDDGLCCPECKAPVPWEWEDACRRRLEEYTRPIHREAIYGTSVRVPLPSRPCGHNEVVELRCLVWADWGEVRAYTYGDHYSEVQPPIIPTRRRAPWAG